MCHASSILFGVSNLTAEDVTGKDVLDIGSHDYNGNFSPIVKNLKPSKFIGIDIIPGPGVDIVCSGEEVVEKFGKNSFDVVVASELMEHARNWREVISNIKNVCKPNGIIFITTRSKGFRLHGYPHDYWRYELDDMRKVFADCEILVLESDRQAPGVFIKAKKPVNFKEVSLKDISLCSVIEKNRILSLDSKKEKKFQKRYEIYRKIIKLRSRIEGAIFRLVRKLAF